MLRRQGIEFQTENDTEVAAGYLEWRLREGASLEQANTAAHPTVRLASVDSAYWTNVGTKEHLVTGSFGPKERHARIGHAQFARPFVPDASQRRVGFAGFRRRCGWG